MRNFIIFGLNYSILGLMMVIPVLIYPPLILLSFITLFIGRLSSDMRTNGKYEKLSSVESSGLNTFLSDLGEEDFEIRKSIRESGAVIHRIGESNIYILPAHTEPEKETAEAKAVLSHEYSHVKNDHKIKSIVYDTASISLNAFLLGVFGSVWVVPLFVINCFVLLPLLKNYISHRFEYQSDNYAVKQVSVEAVQNRLRRNSHLQTDSKFSYSTTHPSVQMRMDKISQLSRD